MSWLRFRGRAWPRSLHKKRHAMPAALQHPGPKEIGTCEKLAYRATGLSRASRAATLVHLSRRHRLNAARLPASTPCLAPKRWPVARSASIAALAHQALDQVPQARGSEQKRLHARLDQAVDRACGILGARGVRCLSTELSAFLNGRCHFFWRPHMMLPWRVQPDLFDVLPVARLP